MTTAGIYIHIPFCKVKCMYCDFYSVADREDTLPRFIKAVLHEINWCGIDTRSWTMDTLFIGGGTPSLMEPDHLEALFKVLDAKYDLSQLNEITMEVNPGEAPLEKLKSFRALGVNRLSIGVQSLEPDLLKFLTRIHTVQDVFQTFDHARTAGFSNINCDLIFNIPGQSFEIWKRDIKKIIELGPEHLSAYSLTVEKGTPLYQYVKKGTVTMPGDDQSADLYGWTQDILESWGYDQYEISNWSKPGKGCLHNMHYWRIDPYLAFGPSAHGFDGLNRYSNLRNLDAYLKSIESNRLPRNAFIKNTDEDLTNELIGFGLRISEGIDLRNIPETFEQKVRDSINKGREKWGNYFIEEPYRLQLTPEGFHFADAIAVDLMV